MHESAEFLTAGLTILGTFLLFIIKEFVDTFSCYWAIMTELKGLKEIFESTFMKEIENAKLKGILWFKYPLNTDYYTMYNNNCERVGKIFIPKLRTLIVSSYTLAKYFLDCLRTNNECIEYYEDVVSGKVKGTVEDAEYALKYSFNNNIIPTVEKMKELLKYI